MKALHYLSTIILVLFLFARAETVTDEQIGYTLDLPDNWVQSKVDATQNIFEDTSGTYQSMIVIVKYDFSEETIFTSADEWTRANFISYAFSVDADPFSVMAFYDTVDAKQNESIWAADAFSQFFSIDTVLSDWAEYIRFAASGTNGYEIYAIGPMDDMDVNIGFYLAVIENIILTDVSEEHMVGVTVPRPAGYNKIAQSVKAVGRYNLLGRTTQMVRTSSVTNMMIYRTPEGVQRKLVLR